MQDPNIDAPPTPRQTPMQARNSLTTLLLGVVIGGAITYTLMGFSTRSAQQTAAMQAATQQAAGPRQEALSEAAIREAARQGAATAIAEIPSRPVQQPQEQEPPAQPVAGPAPQPKTFNASARDLNTLGKADAPITVIEYSDFDCGYCRRFYDTTFKQLMAEYVNTGLVRISYKHYPFLADSSMPKAVVAECAAEQGKFWQMHDALFSGRVPAADEATIRAAGADLAKQFGMDGDAFAKCLDSEAVKQRIGIDAQEAQQVGVRGTPSFLINGRLLVGAQPFEQFKLALEAARKS
jgi:protein-disulfide isomerase